MSAPSDERTPLELANYLDAYCGYDPKSLFHTRVHEAAALIRNLQAENAELRKALDFSQWSESQVDAARGMLIYYLGGTQTKWSLRDHMRAGGYEIPLNDRENYNGLPKNLVVQLILRIATSRNDSAPKGEPS